MIYVTLGTHPQSFSRIIDIVAKAAEFDDLVVQYGHTRPIDLGAHVEWIEFVPYEEANRLIAESSAVVAHAGVGSLMSAIAAGHVPVAVPRLRRYAEHVDDHQLQISERLSREGLAVVCHSADEFPTALEIARRPREATDRQAPLVDEIVRAVQELVA